MHKCTETVSYTPGPWEAASVGGCWSIRGDGKGHVVAFTNGGSMSKYRANNGGGMDAEQEANARLIAAAPQMLAALKRLYPLLADKGMREEIGALLNEIEL